MNKEKLQELKDHITHSLIITYDEKDRGEYDVGLDKEDAELVLELIKKLEDYQNEKYGKSYMASYEHQELWGPKF